MLKNGTTHRCMKLYRDFSRLGGNAEQGSMSEARVVSEMRVNQEEAKKLQNLANGNGVEVGLSTLLS